MSDFLSSLRGAASRVLNGSEGTQALRQGNAQFRAGPEYREEARRFAGVDGPQNLSSFRIQRDYSAVQDAARGRAANLFAADVNPDKGVMAQGRDTLVDVAGGFTTGALNLVALGASGVSAAQRAAGQPTYDAGVPIAAFAEDTGEWFNGLRTNEANDAAAAYEAAQGEVTDNNRRLELEAVANGENSFLAGATRIGRDVRDTAGVALRQPEALGSGIAQGIGSLLLGGPVSKGATSVVTAGARAFAARGLMSPRLATAVAEGFEQAAMTGTIASMEAGGAYSQAANVVMGMSHADLMENSPQYAELIGRGIEPARAQNMIASRAGGIAAAIQAPIAAATGRMVAGFEAAPLAGNTIRGALSNIGKEAVEEGVQSFSGSLNANIGVRLAADENYDLGQGVGRGLAEGSIFGAGTAGVFAGPAIGAGVIERAPAAVRGAVTAIRDRGRAINNRNAVDTTAATAAAVQAATTVSERAAPTDASIDPVADAAERAQYQDQVDRLGQAFNFNPAEYQPQNATEAGLIASLDPEQPQDIFTVMTAAASQLENPDLNEMQKLELALFIHNTQERVTGENLSEVLELQSKARPGGSIAQIATEVLQAQTLITEHKAFNKVMEDVFSEMSEVTVDEVADIETVEGQQAAQKAAMQALLTPENIRPEVVERLLKHSTNRPGLFSRSQALALRSTTALNQSLREAEAMAKELGVQAPEAVRVAGQIQTGSYDKDSTGLSVREHYDAVIEGLSREGDGGLEALTDFRNFAQHMANKLTALNTSFNTRVDGKTEGGDNPTVSFDTYSRKNKAWETDGNAVYAARFSKPSIVMGQQIGVDAQYTIGTYNKLVAQNPQLGLEPVEDVQLDAGLRKAPSEVLRAANAQQTAERQAKTEPKTKQQKQPDVKADTKPAEVPAEPVVEPDKEPAVKDAPYSAKKLKDAPTKVLEDRLVQIQGRMFDDTPLPNDAANFERLTAELRSRETPLDTGVSPSKPEAVEAVAEPEAQPEVTATEEIAPVEKKNPLSIKEVFPNLIQSTEGENLFVEGYTFDPEAASQFMSDTPIGVGEVVRALSDGTAFAELTGMSAAKITPRVSQAYNLVIGKVALGVFDKMKSRLVSSRKNAKGKETNDFMRYMNGQPVGSKAETIGINLVGLRLINLMERQADGSLDFNETIKDAARLAFADWVAQNSVTSHARDKEAVGKALGIKTIDVSDALEKSFNMGLTSTRAHISLTTKLEQYLGLKLDGDTPMGQSRGVMLSLASELLAASLEDDGSGILKREIVEEGDKTFVFYSVNTEALGLVKSDDEGPSFVGQISLIEQIMMKREGAAGYTLGKAEQKPSAKLQKGGATTTQEQKDTQVRENEVPHRINKPLLAIYRYLKADGMLNLFGNGAVLSDTLNKNDRLSKEGQNLAIISAYDHIMGMADIMGDSGQIHYEYEFTSVNRMQQQGSYGSQSSKLTREVITPYGVTLDLTDPTGDEFTMWRRGLAQALGIKVELLFDGVWDEKLTTLLNTDAMQKAVSLIQAYEKTPADELIAALKAAGIDSSVALHALMSHAAYLQADDVSAFETHVYVEADGKTDGPTNSLFYMRTGGFDPALVRALARGGIQFSERAIPLPEYYQEGVTGKPGDAYEAAAQRTAQTMGTYADENVFALADGESTKEALKAQANAVNTVLDTLLGSKDFSVVRNGDKSTFTIGRNQLKNPMTVTVYGSSETGIADKITKELISKLYEEVSKANALATANGDPQAWTGYLFSEQSDKLLPFIEAMQLLTERQVSKNYGKYVVSGVERGGLPLSSKPVDFTISNSAARAMSTSIKTFYVAPMSAAIKAEMGSSVEGSQLIQQSTNMLSVFAKTAFNRLLSNEMDKIKKSDGLSPNQLKSILSKVAFLFPYMEGDVITVNVRGLQNAAPEIINRETGRPAEIRSAANLVNTVAVQMEIPMPAIAGVAGAAYVNISYGDGRMIIKASPGLTGGRLHIFDGINTDLKNAAKNGVAINESVIEAMQSGNPFADLQKTYQEFTSSLNFDIFSDDEMVSMFRETHGEFAKMKNAKAQVLAEVSRLQTELAEKTIDERARQAVYARVHISSDHMAALNAPASTAGQDGREDLSGLSFEQQGLQLDMMFAEERAKIVGDLETEAANPVSESVVAAYNGLPVHKTGVRMVSTDQLGERLDGLKLPKQQAQMVKRALDMLSQSPWTVVIGAKDQANAFAKAAGIPFIFKNGDHGLTAPARKTVVVTNGSAETLAHELIHAATIDRVEAYYDNPQALDPQSRNAIVRLEALQNEWLQVVDDALEFRQQSAFDAVQSAKNAITERLNVGDKAGALNEFMAWNLTNQELVKLNSTIKVESKIARIARDVLVAVSNWFGLPGSTINSNLRFNALLLMDKKLPALNEVAANRLMQHTTHTRPDLDTIVQKFGGLLVQADMGKKLWNGRKPSELAAVVGAKLGDIVSQNGFNLTAEERRAFAMVIAAYRVNMVKDPAFAIKVNAYHRELLAQMNQTNMAEGDAQDPGENELARKRIALLDGTIDLGKDVNGASLMMPMFIGLTAVSPQARRLFSRVQVRAKKKGTPGTTMDEAVTKVTGEMLDSVMQASLGIKTNQKVGEAMDQLVLNLIDQIDKEKNFLQQGMEYPGRVIRGANTKASDFLSFGLGKTSDALGILIKNLPEGTLGYKSAQVVQGAVQMLDKNKVEEATDRIMSEADSTEMNPELRAVITAIAGSNETNQDIFILIKQGRALIDRAREAFRTGLPKQVVSKFTRDLTKQEWTDVHVLGRVDAASLMGQGLTDGDVIDLLADPAALKAMADQKAADIRRLFGAKAPAILGDASDLAALLVRKVPSHGLVKKNAMAIANQAGGPTVGTYALDSNEVRAVDGYVSALAMSQVAPSVQKSLSELAKTQKEGMRYALSLMAKARSIEVERIPTRHIYNVPKGYMPTERLGSFKAVSLDKVNDYTKTGYRVVGTRQPSAVEALHNVQASNIVYVATDLGAPAFRQGIMRTVRTTAFGIDAVSGMSFENPSAGLITEPNAVDRITRALQGKKPADATLAPLFDENGSIYAYERLIDPSEVNNALETQQNAAVSLGHWIGRQHEEKQGAKINEVLIERLAQMYETADRQARTNEYVDLFELEKTDPVIRDAMALISDRDKAMILRRMGDKFMVRRGLVDNVIGFRSMSIGDAWSGNSRIKKENQEALADFMTGLMGPQAYRYLTMGEQSWNQLMGDARVAIVVKSMLVPALNAMANFYQLMANGIGPVQIAQKGAEKLRETHLYAKNELEYQRLSVELAAAEGSQRPDLVRRIETEMRKIEDLNQQLSIWPLIEAGEFSQITEGLVQEDMEMTRGRFWDYLAKKAEKLPEAVKTAGRYAVVSKDTALFAGLAKTVAYTDFVAKAVLFDHLRTNEKLDKKAAQLRITNEFVNYDILDGRMMSYAEGMGLVWFWKFKLRSIKVAASLMRNNPLHVFLSSMVPGSYEAGTVMDDNGINLFLDGRIQGSTGIDNAWRGVEMLPINQALFS